MAEAIEGIVARGSPVVASRFRAWCSKLFSYAVACHLRPDNPAKSTENPVSARDIQRNRKLTDHELSLVWRCAEQLGSPFGPALQLLAITGQRRSEVLEATWSEFNLNTATWVIRSIRSKNGAEHIVPLSDVAVEILRGIPRIEGSPYVFTTTGTSPVSGISKAKARLDQLITAANGDRAIPPWRIHDLRRTFVSGCARLRIPSEVTERAINHVSESFRRRAWRLQCPCLRGRTPQRHASLGQSCHVDCLTITPTAESGEVPMAINEIELWSKRMEKRFLVQQQGGSGYFTRAQVDQLQSMLDLDNHDTATMVAEGITEVLSRCERHVEARKQVPTR